MIAFVWSAATIALPVLESERSFAPWRLVLLFAERFLFVFAITVPFDVRDMRADARSGLQTLPLLLGEKKALALANAALFIFLALCFGHYRSSMAFAWLAFLISGLSTFVFINHRKLQSLPDYHYGILDGTMILQALLVGACFYGQFSLSWIGH